MRGKRTVFPEEARRGRFWPWVEGFPGKQEKLITVIKRKGLRAIVERSLSKEVLGRLYGRIVWVK